jgi:PKD repeat protein
MKKIRVLFFILLITTGISLADAQHSPSMAQLKGVEFLESLHPEGYTGYNLQPEQVWTSGKDTVFVLFSFGSREGFLLISGDGYGNLVHAYSLHNRVRRDDIPPGMEWMIQEYIRQLVPAKNRVETIEAPGSPEQLQGVTPLLLTQWDQRCYYNDSCPSDPQAPAYYCGRAPAGCVATTLAQIMKYHEWPLQGTGTKSYYSIRYGTLSANFGNTAYGWAGMPNALYSSNPEVARLLWHAGVATQMGYGPLASGTGITDARTGLVNYFGYKSSAQIVAKSTYSDQNWKNLMRGELDAGRPVFYSGIDQSSNGGHAWVMDGYASNDYFHFNWGWSGMADGFFLLSALNPLGSANYTSLQEAIIGIEPSGSHVLASFTADQVRIDAGDAVTFTDLSFSNITSWNWFFSGGSPATFSGSQPPPVTWSVGGSYDVMLVVGNGSMVDTLFREAYIKVLPFAGFKASQTATEAGGRIDFFDNSESSSPIQSYQWHFFGGQPAVSTQKNPGGILYAQPGQYPVFLTVNDGNHADQRVELQYITVHSQCDTLLDFFMPGWNVQPVNQAAFQVYQEDLDGLTPYHNQYITSGWQYFSEGGGANHFISATSLFTVPGTADNWLIFGPVTIPIGGATLHWKHKFPDHTKRDGYEVLLSTSGHTSANFTGLPVYAVADNDAFTLGDTVWKGCSAEISAATYGNQQVYVGVHHNAHNMFYIGLDQFKIVHCTGFPNYADFFSFDTIVAAGDTARFYSFSSGTPDQLQWVFPGGIQVNSSTSQPMVLYPQPGVYDVSLTALWGSTSHNRSRSGYIQVTPVSVASPESAQLVIHPIPNPVTNEVLLQGLQHTSIFRIYDLSGRIAMHGTASPGIPINLEMLPSGIWIMSLTDDSGVYGRTVVKLIK